MNEANVEEKLYGCVCKLKDYENTGLSPDEVECLLDEEPRKPALRAQSITQIIPAHETCLLYTSREKRKGQPGGEKRPGDLCAGQDRKRGTDKGGGSRRIHGKLSREKGTLCPKRLPCKSAA